MQISVRPVLFVGINATPYDVGDIISVELEDGNKYIGEIQEIDMENCTLIMWIDQEKENLVSFYIHQITYVDLSV